MTDLIDVMCQELISRFDRIKIERRDYYAKVVRVNMGRMRIEMSRPIFEDSGPTRFSFSRMDSFCRINFSVDDSTGRVTVDKYKGVTFVQLKKLAERESSSLDSQYGIGHEIIGVLKEINI